MTANLLSAIAVFVSTSIDYLVILTIVFAQTRSRRGVTHVTLGLYLGTAILVISSLLAAYVLHFIPEEWIIGLLGLIPIALGIYVAVRKEDDDEDEEDELAERFEQTRENRLFWTMTLITIASGGDNIGVYIPYFASLDASGIISAILTFIVLSAILCLIGYKIAGIRLISETLERYERIIVPIVYIGLGIWILLENGTIQHFIG